MKHQWILALVAGTAALCAGLGCASSTPTHREDGDAGPITLMEAGTRDTGPRPDSGGSSCPESPVALADGSPCSAATRACIMDCGSATNPDMCLVDCIDADAMAAECGDCLDQNIISCANDNGCQREWDLGVCCIDDNCGTVADAGGCIASLCADEQGEFVSCIQGLPAGVCAGAFNMCFPAPTAFAPGTDVARLASAWRAWAAMRIPGLEFQVGR